MKKYFFLSLGTAIIMSALTLAFCVWLQYSQSSPGQAEVAAAARDQQHAFVLFWDKDNDATQGMRQTLDQALAKQGRQARVIMVKADAEKDLVERFGLQGAQLPLVVALAPNGAVTGAYSVRLTEQQVGQAIVSPGMAASMKALQHNKLVLVCVQPASSRELPQGVRDFKADKRYQAATEIITISANDPAEAAFLRQLQIDPATTSPVTVFLGPPGMQLGKFNGTLAKEQLVEILQTSGSRVSLAGRV